MMQILINDGWSFAKLPCSCTYAEAEDAVYQPVDLPHDWLIWQDDLYEDADVWYQRTIEMPEEHDPVILLRFDGVYMDCDVLLNGELICTHPYGYTAFDVPLTGKMHSGGNLLVVHIRHRSPNSRWYSGSGIYRDVFLVTLPEDHMVPDGITLKENRTDGVCKLNVTAEIRGKTAQAFLCTLITPDGKTAAAAEGLVKGNQAEASLTVSDARLWSPNDPYLYSLQIRYGQHTETIRTGLRSVSADPEKGFLLNGQAMKLQGVCLHHDLGALGAAFHEKAARRQLALMKEMGANAVRTSHNPPASRFLDLCDEMGILVVDEAFDMWERQKTAHDYARFFPAWHRKDVASWIRRDRIHACVIMWSIGNEIYDIHADLRGTEVTKMLTEEVRKHDPGIHALTTFGCNYMPWEGGQRCADYVDAVGYNYGEKLYEQHHAAHPSWVIYGSETASVLSSRGVYHFPIEQSIMSDADRQCSALGNSNTSWGAENLRKMLIDDVKQRFSMGQFIWSGTDYIGEPTPYHTRSCYFGQADTAGFPKDAYYLFQAFWSDRSMIHIGVHWDWNPGQLIDIPVMTNCAEAELFLNGVSMGRKQRVLLDNDRCVPLWKLPFTAGELTAVGYDSEGNKICEDRRITPGNTDHLLLTCEDNFLDSDGWDLAFVTVSAQDAAGHPVENARDRVKVTVTGGGRLIGTDNGDSTDTDSYKSDCRRLFSGKLLLIIASNGRREDVLICANRQEGTPAVLRIPVRFAPIKQGVSFTQKAVNGILPEAMHTRKIQINALDSTRLNNVERDCRFAYQALPENAKNDGIIWQITNAAGIETPFVRAVEKDGIITVHADGDGAYYLRALCMEKGQCAFISQIEFSASGIGSPALDPYTYLSAGLYDLHEGEIGAGNEKGVAFARDAHSMVGFSCVDFGKTGSDQITADIFALDSRSYCMELWAARPGETSRKIAELDYQKPSIWNVYQAETWSLPERLKGVQTLYFRMKDKIHLKGFKFEKQENAYIEHPAGSADAIYGDSFRREGTTVADIGNNVTLIWQDMDFGNARETALEICGRTKLPVNTINVRIRNLQGEETVTAAEFKGKGDKVQRFDIKVPEGRCSVSFVFLPGSSFDFNAFRFYKPDGWTECIE